MAASLKHDDPGARPGTRVRSALIAFLTFLAGMAFTQVAEPRIDRMLEAVGLRSPDESSKAIVTPSRSCDSTASAEPEEQIELIAREDAAQCWQPELAALQPGQSLQLAVQYRNRSSEQQDNVTIKVQLPRQARAVPRSGVFGTEARPTGQRLSGDVTKAGVNIGSYAPGGGTFVLLQVKVSGEVRCGRTALVATASARSDPMTSSAPESQTTVLSVYRYC